MMNAVEIMDAQDLVADLADISDFVRIEHHDDAVADDIDKACQTLANLIERFRSYG